MGNQSKIRLIISGTILGASTLHWVSNWRNFCCTHTQQILLESTRDYYRGQFSCKPQLVSWQKMITVVIVWCHFGRTTSHSPHLLHRNAGTTECFGMPLQWLQPCIKTVKVIDQMLFTEKNILGQSGPRNRNQVEVALLENSRENYGRLLVLWAHSRCSRSVGWWRQFSASMKFDEFQEQLLNWFFSNSLGRVK